MGVDGVDVPGFGGAAGQGAGRAHEDHAEGEDPGGGAQRLEGQSGQVQQPGGGQDGTAAEYVGESSGGQFERGGGEEWAAKKPAMAAMVMPRSVKSRMRSGGQPAGSQKRAQAVT